MILGLISLNSFDFFFRAGTTNIVIARQAGVEYPLNMGQHGGAFESATDGRYVCLVYRVQQGKGYDPNDLIGMIFDCQAKKWLDVPDGFFDQDSGVSSKVLWIKKGSEDSHGYAPDPGGNVRHHSFISPTEIQYATVQFNSSGPQAGIAIDHTLWRRTIDLATGTLGPIHQIDNSVVPPLWL